MDKRQLVYEYNMMIIERYQARSATPRSPPGKHRIEVETTIAKPAGPGGRSCSRSTARRSAGPLWRGPCPAAFTASETFDVGVDLGSPVSLDYFDRRPFRFNGEIERVDVEVFAGVERPEPESEAEAAAEAEPEARAPA